MIQRLHLAYTPSRRCFALAVSSSRVRLWVVPDMPSHAKTNDTMHLAHVVDVETGRSGIVGLSFLDDQTLLVAHSDGVLQAWALLVGEDSAVHLKVPLKGHFETLPSLHGDTEAASTMDLLGELNQLKQGGPSGQTQHGTFRTFTQRPVEIEGQSLKARLIWSLTLDGRMESCAIWHEFSTWETVKLALGTQSGDVFVIEVQVGQQPRTRHLAHHQSTVSLVSFSRDGLLLATCSRQRDIAIWRDAQDKPWRQFKGSGGEIWALKFSPSGRYIISGGIDNSVYYWDILAKRPLRAMNRDHDGWIAGLAWSDDERVVASASWDNTVGLFRAGDMAPLYCFDFHEDYVVDVLFAPETNYLISASYDHQIAVWDWRHAQLVAKLEGHEDWVQSLVWMGNGMVASAASDKTVRVWSIEALKCEYLLCDKVRPTSDIDLADPFSLGSAFSSSSWASDEPYQPIVHDTGFGQQRVSGRDADASVQRAVEAVQHVEETGLGEVSMFFDDAPSMFNPKKSTIDHIESQLPVIEEPSLVSDAEEINGLPGDFNAPLMPMRQSTADELGEALFDSPAPEDDASLEILDAIELQAPDDDATKEFKLDISQVDALKTPPAPVQPPPVESIPRETASWPASLGQASSSAASVSGDEIFAQSEASSAIDAPSSPKSDLDITAEALDIVSVEESEADRGWDWEFSEASASASEVFEDSQPSEISEPLSTELETPDVTEDAGVAFGAKSDLESELEPELVDDEPGQALSLEAYLQSVVQSEASEALDAQDAEPAHQDLVEISIDQDGPEEVVDIFSLEELSLSERVSSVADDDEAQPLVESSITDEEESQRDQARSSGFSFPSMSASIWGDSLGQSASEGLNELSMVNWEHYERSGFGQPAMLLDGSNSEVSIMTESVKSVSSPAEEAEQEELEEVSTPPAVDARVPDDASSEQEAISDVEAFAVDALSQPSEALSVAVSVPVEEEASSQALERADDAPEEAPEDASEDASESVSEDVSEDASTDDSKGDSDGDVVLDVVSDVEQDTDSEPIVDDEKGSTSAIQALSAPVEASSDVEEEPPIAGIEVEIQMVPASSDTSDPPAAPSATIADVISKPQHDWGDFDNLSDAVEDALSLVSETPEQSEQAPVDEAPAQADGVDEEVVQEEVVQESGEDAVDADESSHVGATQEDAPVLTQSSENERSDVLGLAQPEDDLMESSELAPEAALSLERPRESGGFVMLDEFSMAEESMSSSASSSSSASHSVVNQTPSGVPSVDVPEALGDEPSSEVEEGVVPDSFDAPSEASALMERSEHTETKEFSRVALKQALRRKMLAQPEPKEEIPADFQTQPNIVGPEEANDQTNTGWNQGQISDAFKAELNESLDRHSDQETLSQNAPQQAPSFHDREQTVVDASPAGMVETLDGRQRSQTMMGHVIALPEESSEALELEPLLNSDAKSNSEHVVDDIFERAETVADASPLWAMEAGGESQLPGRRPRLVAEGEASQLGAKEALSEQTRPEDVAFEALLQQVPEVENVSGTIGFGSPMPAFALQQLKEQAKKARANKYKPMPEDVCETFELTISETWQMRLAERKAAMKIFKKRKSAGSYRRWDRLDSHHDRVDHVSYCEEGRFYVVAGDQPVIEIWTLKHGRVGTLATQAPVKHVVVTSDGRVVIAGDDAGVLQLWLLPTNITTMSQAALGMVSIDGPGRVRGLSLDIHGRYLFSAHQSGVGRLWDLVDGSHVATLHHHGGDILGVGFDPNGPISSSEDHILRFWNTEGQVDGLIGGAGELTQMIARQRDLYALSVDGELHCYKNQEHQSSVTFDDHPVDLDVNHEGMLAIAGESGKIYLYPTGLNDEPIELNMGEPVCSVAICGPFVVVGTKDGGLELLKRT